MPFDPTIPVTNAEATSAMFRGQFNGLHDLIAAIVQIVAAQVDGVTTLNPGESATVSVAIVNQTVRFTIAIPRGDEGLPGQPGMDGAVGPPFAQLIIDAVNTLNPGELATVGQSVAGNEVHLTFSIPRGNDGGQGIQGNPGADGAAGEVTNAQLTNAISGTSNNTNAVATLDTPFADPDAESMRQRFNELVQALRR